MTLTRRGRLVAAILTLVALLAFAAATPYIGTPCATETVQEALR